MTKPPHFKKPTISSSPTREESPIQAVRSFTALITNSVDSRMYSVFRAISKDWLGLEQLSKAGKDDLPFSIKGIIHINLKTGKPLTVGEWKKITAAIDKMLAWTFGDAETLVGQKSIALGKLLASMPIADVVDTSLTRIPYQTISIDPYLSNSVLFAEQSAANYITGVSDTLRKDIKSTIVEAQKNKWGSRQLESALFDKFATRNRDFRMIAETELNSNVQAGYLLTQLDQAKEDETVFAMGISNQNACPYCKAKIHNQMFVVLPEASSNGSDSVVVKGRTYTAIWPGKNNVGRSKTDWRQCIPVHPHCACTFLAVPKTTAAIQEIADKARAKVTAKLEGYKNRMPLVDKLNG